MKKLTLLITGAISAVTLQAQLTFSTITSASCFSPCTGSSTVYVTSTGTPIVTPITYTIFGCTFSSSSSSTNSFVVNNLCSCPAYTLCVMSSNGLIGCTTFSMGTISTPFISTVTTVPATPPAPMNSYLATAQISGGTPPYYVMWYNSMMTPIKNHTVNANQDTVYLYPGDYFVSVTDSVNTSNGCGGGPGGFYPFSICGNAGTGFINILPNDTLCAGTTFTVQYFPIPFGPVNIINANIYSNSPSCFPPMPNNPFSTFTCTATQNITFSGEWYYSINCPPVPYNPADIYVTTCTNIHSNSLSSDIINIFPNPNNGNWKIYSNSSNKSAYLKIFDITGKLIFDKSVNLNEEINTNLQDGIYFAHIKIDEKEIVQKLIIKH
jgi:hypothetical protein